jgi:hydrogenase maturation protease
VTPRVLVAGIGNIFLGDDGFGVEVARELRRRELPDGVQVGDYGTSGMHLAFDLLAGYGTTILLDAAPRGDAPGTVSLLEVREEDRLDARSDGSLLDAHGMQPEAVLALLAVLGGDAGRVLVVCCEPAEVDQRIGLSEPVARAVPIAVEKVVRLLDDLDHESSSASQREEV